ncbi:hypothetical protein CN272_27925 [Bacillus anthracis]|nr:hypothetical protein CN272_27925 [Bacillus anthracis]PFD87210.1 hypothetical protein CN275_20285 [Bacillus anthracis]PFT20063.1 hypothetical protein COK52_22775 [Bacillus thuringiensis]
MKTVLITGGSGNLGTLIIKFLKAKNYRIINISRNKPFLLCKEDIHVSFDFLNQDSFNILKHTLQRVNKIDIIIFAAAIDSYLDFYNFNTEIMDKILKVNCYSYIQLLEILKNEDKIHNDTILYGISSNILEIMEKDSLAYGISKAAFEEINRQFLKHSIIREVHIIRLPFIGVNMGTIAEKDNILIKTDEQLIKREIITKLLSYLNVTMNIPSNKDYNLLSIQE